MRSLLIAALLGVIGLGAIGCHASGDVDNDTSGGSTYKKTTTVTTPDGNTSTYKHTETHNP